MYQTFIYTILKTLDAPYILYLMVSYDTIHRAINIHKVSTCLGKLLFNVSETNLKV